MTRKKDPIAEPVIRERESDGPPSTSSGVRTVRNTLPWMTDEATGLRRKPRTSDTIPDQLAPAARRATLRGIKLRQSIVPTEAPPPPNAEPPKQEAKKRASKPERRDTSRAYVAVDDVGAKAMQLARSLRPSRAPRVIATRDEIRKAPLEQCSAFVLAFIDGTTDEDGLVDVTGLPERTIREALAELTRLGLIEVVDRRAAVTAAPRRSE